MIRGWAVRTVIGKELLEVARDRRTLFLMVILPLLVYPLLFLATTQVAVSQVQKIQATTVRIGVTAEVPSGLRDQLQPKDRIELVPTTLDRGLAMVQSGELAGLLTVTETHSGGLAGGGTVALHLAYDATSETSNRAQGQLKERLTEWRKRLVAARLVARDLPPSLLHPISLRSENIAPARKVSGHLLGQIVPLLIVMMVVLGAFYPAIEVTAGEKERGTLQTLLTAPLRPLEIILAKFVAVCAVAFIAGLANILSIGLLLLMVKFMPGADALPFDVGISGGALAIIGLVSLLVGLLFSAVMMTVAVLARTFKEAQAYTTPVYLLSVAPVMFAQLPGMRLTGVLAFIPGLNQALLMREELEGTATAQQIFAVVVSSLVFTAGTLVVAARIFERESILLGEAGVRALFTDDGRRRPTLVPRPGEAIALLAICFVLFFYAGGALQAWRLLAGLAISHWGLLLGAVLAFIGIKHLDPVATLGLRKPGWRPLAAALLLGLSLWYPVGLGLEWLVSPDPDDPTARMLASLLSGAPLWALLLVIAATPAVTEEFLFRGVLLRALQPWFSPRAVLWTTALLFGAFHMSAARMIPTTLLGLVLGALALRSGSIFPGMLFHLLHNGASLLIARLEVKVPGVTTRGALVPWHVALVVVSLALGLWCLRASKPSPRLPADSPD